MQLGVCSEAARRGVSAARLLSTGDSFALHRFTATRRRREVIAPCGVCELLAASRLPDVSLSNDRAYLQLLLCHACAAVVQF